MKKTDMIIRSNEAKQISMNILKGKKAVEAVAEVKDEKGKVTQKAVPAGAATPDMMNFWIAGTTKEICQELIARISESGFQPNEKLVPVEIEYGIKFGYTFPPADQPKFRAAFKKAKSTDNEAGLAKEKAAKAAEQKATKAAEKAAAKDAEKDSGPSVDDKIKANSAAKAGKK